MGLPFIGIEAAPGEGDGDLFDGGAKVRSECKSGSMVSS